MIMLRLPVFLKLILVKALMRIYIENVDEVEDFVYEEYLEIFISLVDSIENFEDMNHLHPAGNHPGAKPLDSYFMVSFSDCFEINSYNPQFNYEVIKGIKLIMRLGITNTNSNMIETQNQLFETLVRSLLNKVCAVYSSIKEHPHYPVREMMQNLVKFIIQKTPVNFLKKEKEDYRLEIKKILRDLEEQSVVGKGNLDQVVEGDSDQLVMRMIKQYSETPLHKQH